MKHNLFSILLALLLVVSATGNAQNLPYDPDLRHGKLKNGLTYFIQKSTNPQGKASFFLPQKVGSMQENDNQKGLAHFLEHMAFSSTKHFPENVTSALEKRGVTFGRNINAYTSYDQTVYYLTDVPVADDYAGLIDTCMLILHDWCGYISLRDEDIDKERKVIKEEWRTRDGAGYRISTKQIKDIFAGSKYEDRSPIGDMDVVENFKYEELRDYYRRWYRPDLQGIIIVGDIDVDEVEKKVTKLFSTLEMPKNPEMRIYHPVPDNDEPIISIITDKEATNISVSIYNKSDIIPFDKRNTKEFLLLHHLSTMAGSILSSRLSEIQQKPEAPFSYAYSAYSGFSVAMTKNAFTIAAGCKEGRVEDVFRVLEEEKERIRRFGFTESEIERAKTNLLKGYENRNNNRSTQTTGGYVDVILHNFLISGPITGVEFEYNLLKDELIPQMTVEVFNEWAKKYITDKNIVVTLSGPEKEGIVYPQPQEIIKIMSDAKKADLKPYEDKVPEGNLISNLPAPGKVVKETKHDKYDLVEWTLSNDMRVTFKKTDFVADGIQMSASSYGGTSHFEDNEIFNAGMAANIAGIGGWGDFSSIDMDKMLTGKSVRVGSSISAQTQTMSGSSSIADLETMFQLIYLRFTAPRKDTEMFNTLIDRLKNQLLNQEANPNTTLSDSINYAMYGDNPRVFRIKAKDLDKLDYDRMLEIYRQCFSNPGSFVMQFTGSINEDSLRAYSEKYLACLPSGNKDIMYVDRNSEIRKGKYVNKFTKKGETPKASSYIMYSGTMEYIDTVSYSVQILNGVLSEVLRRSLRGEEGGTYGARSNYNIARIPKGQTTLTVSFDTDPQRIDEMNGIVFRELEKLANEGPAQEDFDKSRQSLLKNFETYQRLNGYWNAVLNSYYFLNEDENGSVDYQGQFMMVTKDRVKQLVKGLLDQGNCIEVVMITEP